MEVVDTLTKDKKSYIKNVSEYYDEIFKKATRNAQHYTDNLMQEIKYFKTHSFEEMVEHLDESNIEEIMKKGSPFDSSFLNQYIYRVLIQKHGAIYRDDMIELLNSMTEEEKNEIIKAERKSTYEKQKEETRKLDLLYDSMSEEQIKKYLELYYISKLKENIAKYKEEMVNLDHDIVFEAASIDYMGDKERVQKKAIKQYFIQEKETFTEKLAPKLGAGALGTVAGFSTALGVGYIDKILDSNLYAANPYLAPAIVGFCVASAIALLPVMSLAEKKRVIRKAKETGLYNDIIEQLKATNNFEKFKSELEEELGIEDGVKSL